MNWRGYLRSLLSAVGKRDRKVAAVFGLSPPACHTAVLHLRQGAPDVPVWLYAIVPPWPETEALCERICVRHSSLVLFVRAQVELWRHWVALGVSTWTGERGAWPVKLAPLMVPPFRAVLLNEHGDFFGGSPAPIAVHMGRRVQDAVHKSWHRLQDFWLLASYHVWRSARVRRLRDVASARLLQITARALVWCGSPHRRLMNGIPGRERLEIPASIPGGVGVETFTPHADGWNSDTFANAVLKSRARWLLWTEEGTSSSVEDLLPLFRDEHTFAVSRQEEYRAWTPGILPTAPFRPLQTGESCRVLAPLGRTILVDRVKLAALGIPRSGLPGSTWMLLFWKAAAAGWASYSVGQGVRPVRRPDRPAEETSFFFQLIARRRLRRLELHEPDLSRGTISTRARSSTSANRQTARPRVLVVSPFLPYPLSHGGAVRIYNLCRALAGKVDFALAAIREQNEQIDYDRLHSIFSQVHVVDLDEPASSEKQLPRQVRHHQSRSLHALISNLCKTWNPNLVQIEYTHLAAFREAATGTPALLVEHDITFSLYRQLAESRPSAGARAEYERWHKFESQWLSRFEGVWTVSNEDRALALGERSRPDGTFVIPNGVDTSRFVPTEQATAAPEVLYVGSFRHLPNVIGFDRLRREIMPHVWERFPRARLRVVAGSDYEIHWQRFAHCAVAHIDDPRMTVHGFVEDLSPLYAKAALVVVPLEVSAGTNIKVLEAMACGKAVVSTPVGCAGLGLRDGEDAVIRSSNAPFAAAVCELLASAAQRCMIGAEARRTVERFYSWSAIAEQAYASYLSLAQLAPEHSRLPGITGSWIPSQRTPRTCEIETP